MLTYFGNEATWLGDVDLLLEVAFEERRIDVFVVDLLALMCYQSKD